MDQQRFQTIRQYVGQLFLDYVLNQNFGVDKLFSELTFSKEQLYVLEQLDGIITSARIDFVIRGSFGDGTLLKLKNLDNETFNNFRRQCGGEICSISNTDPVVNYLQNIAVKYYPNLLIKSDGDQFNAFTYMHVTRNFGEFSNIIKKDFLNELTNKKDGVDHSFKFKLTNGNNIYQQVDMACGNLIHKSFQNVSNRMKYSLTDLLREIETNIISLRDLAKGNEISFSSFVGLQGLYFENLSEIRTDEFVLRKIDSQKNPSVHTNRSLLGFNENEKHCLAGSFLEIFHRIKLAEVPSQADYSIHTASIYNEQLPIIERIRFALLFVLDKDRGIQTTFFEDGFPLIPTGNYSFGFPKHSDIWKVENEHLPLIHEWLNNLNTSDLTRFRVVLKRLQYAIFERQAPEDSILDAFIAWEAMFSGESETRFKVTGSIAKYLESNDSRIELYKRLKVLYKYRSSIAHGEKNNKFEKEDVNKLRIEVIQIGLRCLKKLLKDTKLATLSPSERADQLLVLEN